MEFEVEQPYVVYRQKSYDTTLYQFYDILNKKKG